MKEKIQKIQKKINTTMGLKAIVLIVLLMALSFMLMGVTFAFSSGVFNVFLYSSYLKSPLLMFMNFIPIFLLMGVIFLLSNRLWLAYYITSVLFFLMGVMNKLKLTYRDDPFVFSDIILAGESIEMAGRYDVSLSGLIYLLVLGLVGVGLILMFFFDFRIKIKRIRYGVFALVVLVTTLLINGFYFDTKIYGKVGDDTLVNRWIESDLFQTKGFVYPFLYSIKDVKKVIPKGYDELEAEKILAQYTDETIKEDQKVNLVTIMLEAYNDLSKFDGVDIHEDVYGYFHELQGESISGHLLTNVFAGGTINTERAFLTGYFKQPSYRTWTDSYVWYLREQGYKTEAMHPTTGSFYNRRNGNEYIGFENFDYYENKYHAIQETYLMDMDFFDYIIEGFETSVEEGRPYFNYALTFQNHGPYSDEKYIEEDYLVKKSNYNEGDYNIVNNYLEGISRTVGALEKLVTYFENSQEPVVLVFFGDHNPWLGQDNSAYDMMGINMDLGTVEGFRNYYEIPYVIWANKAAKEVTGNDFVGMGQDISPNHLMGETFDYIGWKGDRYMQYVNEMKVAIPINHHLYFQENGSVIPKDSISLATKDLWQEFNYLEFYRQNNYEKN